MNTNKGNKTMNTHRITRDGKTHSEHASENAAFAALLKCQGQSVHHATTFEGWAVVPVEAPAPRENGSAS